MSTEHGPAPEERFLEAIVAGEDVLFAEGGGHRDVSVCHQDDGSWLAEFYDDQGGYESGSGPTPRAALLCLRDAVRLALKLTTS